jgi:hypothetical protein
MGNEQSTTQTQRQIVSAKRLFKILYKVSGEEMVKRVTKDSGTDDINKLAKLVYESGINGDCIYYMIINVKSGFMAYINCVNRAPFNNYQAGNYVEIN